MQPFFRQPIWSHSLIGCRLSQSANMNYAFTRNHIRMWIMLRRLGKVWLLMAMRGQLSNHSKFLSIGCRCLPSWVINSRRTTYEHESWRVVSVTCDCCRDMLRRLVALGSCSTDWILVIVAAFCCIWFLLRRQLTYRMILRRVSMFQVYEGLHGFLT